MNQALRLAETVDSPRLAPVPLPRVYAAPLPSALETDLLRLIRRRYRTLIPLMLLGMILGGLGAWRFWTPSYRSRGLIQISPTARGMLSPRQSEATLPMYEAFMTSQVSLLKGEQLVQRAVQNPKWTPFAPQSSEATAADFAGRLDVVRVPGSELLKVTFWHPKAEAASAGVNAIIEAYLQSLADQDGKVTGQQIQTLQQRREELASQWDAIQTKVMQIGAEYGTDDLQQLYLLQLQEVNRLATMLRESGQALAAADQQQPEPGATSDASGSVNGPVAVFDPVLRQFLKDKAELEQHIEKLSTRLGSNHHSLTEARALLAWVDKSIQRHSQELRESGKYVAAAHYAPVAGVQGITVVEDQRDRRQRLQSLYQQTLANTAELGRRNLESKQLRTQAENLAQAINETDRRIDEIRLDLTRSLGSRVNVISTGDRPSYPISSHPRTLVLLGALVGAAVFGGFVLLSGASDRKLRSFDELRPVLGATPVVGVLPTLPRKVAGSRRAAAAARAVRQLASWIQIWRGAGDRRVLAITSPTSGDGKTSLAMALGVSLAEAGCRTLLIDCDLVGRGLTARAGEISPASIAGALRPARSDGSQPASTSLLPEPQSNPESSATAGTTTTSITAGLLEAMRGEGLEKCLMPTRTPGLSLLPIAPGSAASESLSLMALRRLIGRARKHFDLVVIDTGPVCASPEAPLVAEEADGALLVVSRGDPRHLVQAALQQLGSIEARVMGVVYNRAAHSDAHAVGSAVRSGNRSSGDSGSSPSMGFSRANQRSAGRQRNPQQPAPTWPARPAPAPAAQEPVLSDPGGRPA